MKHRLVGAAVLVALGVIAWPVIFDTTPVREISQRSQIPDPPSFERFDVDEPRVQQLPPAPDYTAERAASAVPAEPAPAEIPAPDSGAKPDAAQTPAAEAPAAERPALLDEHELPVQWAVQLGVFSKIENAQEIKRRAEKAGYHAILQDVSEGARTQYRVYAEPKLDKPGAQRVAAEIEKKLGVKGYVTRYYP